MKKQLLILAAIATIITAMTGCTAAQKTRLYHDGKMVIAIVKPIARQLAEDELRALIEEATK